MEKYFFLLLLLLTCVPTFSQIVREKIYVQTDKDNYLVGDTIWFKGYLIDASTNQITTHSGIVYIEIKGPEFIALKKMAVHSYGGMFAGYISITRDDSWKDGIYSLNAFTKWMLNFGDSLYFTKAFKIRGNKQKMIISQKYMDILPLHDSTKIIYRCNISDHTGYVASDSLFQFHIMDKNQRLITSGNVSTDSLGNLSLTANMSNKQHSRAYFLTVNTMATDHIVIRETLRQETKLDVQFLPEGGYMIAGCENTIGIKSLNSNGLGISVSGKIINNKGNEIVSFDTPHKGMGIVRFYVAFDESYYALMDDGTKITLPSPYRSGTLIQVRNDRNNKDITAKIFASNDKQSQEYILNYSLKNDILFSKKIYLNRQDTLITIPFSVLKAGIGRIQLIDQQGRILNERACFIPNEKKLNIQIELPKKEYHIYDSIPLVLKVTDTKGKPVQGSFTVAVTDDKQVYKDVENRRNIQSYLLLDSDINGNIEDPNYFLHNNDAMEALLLTQGFVRYDWDTSVFQFLPEKEFTVSGVVTNIFNKGIKKARLHLIGYNNKYDICLLKDTIVDDKGRFVFNNFPAFDSLSFIVKAMRKSNFNINIGIDFDIMPWKNTLYPPVSGNNFEKMDSLIGNASRLRYDSLTSIRKRNNELEEVTVYSRYPVIGNPDQTVKVNEISPYFNQSLYQLLKNTVKGFGYDWCRCENGAASYYYYTINGQPIRTVFIDGRKFENLAPVYSKSGPTGRYKRTSRLSSALNQYYLASDIKSIEVFSNPEKSEEYLNFFGQDSSGKFLFYFKDAKCRWAYIVIRTHVGGPNNTPGVEYYTPPSFSYNKSFYVPKYTDNTKKSLPLDMRSTIYWNPGGNATDMNGKIGYSFYAAGIPTSYNIEIEGMDMNGNIGYYNEKINIIR